jgi:hypothetical protein
MRTWSLLQCFRVWFSKKNKIKINQRPCAFYKSVNLPNVWSYLRQDPDIISTGTKKQLKFKLIRNVNTSPLSLTGETASL